MKQTLPKSMSVMHTGTGRSCKTLQWSDDLAHCQIERKCKEKSSLWGHGLWSYCDGPSWLANSFILRKMFSEILQLFLLPQISVCIRFHKKSCFGKKKESGCSLPVWPPAWLLDFGFVCLPVPEPVVRIKVHRALHPTLCVLHLGLHLIHYS